MLVSQVFPSDAWAVRRRQVLSFKGASGETYMEQISLLLSRVSFSDQEQFCLLLENLYFCIQLPLVQIQVGEGRGGSMDF